MECILTICYALSKWNAFYLLLVHQTSTNSEQQVGTNVGQLLENCTKPLGIRVVLRVDNHGSPKMK